MKKLLPVFFVLITLNAVYAQTLFNKVVHTIHNVPGSLLIHEGNSYFTSLKHHPLAGDSLMLFSFGPSGNFRFKKTFAMTSNMSGGSLFASHDGKIILLYLTHYCSDVVMPGEAGYTTFFTKLDTDGTVLFSKPFTDRILNRGLVITGSNDYALYSGSAIMRINGAGVRLDSTHAISGIVAVGNYSANCLLVSTTSTAGLAVQHLLSPSLGVQQTLMASSTYAKHMKHNGFYYARTTNGKIEKLNAQLQPEATTATMQGNAAGNTFVDFTVMNDTVHAIGTNNSSTTQKSFYMKLKGDLSSIVSQSGNATNCHSPSSIGVKGDTVYIVGSNVGNVQDQYKSNYVSFTALRKNDQYQFSSDVLLRRATIDDHSYQVPPVLPGGYIGQFVRYNVVVVNNGSNVISSFFINAGQIYFGYECNWPHWQQRVGDINLAPGDSIKITTNFIQLPFISTVPMTSVYQCLYLTGPNDGNDTNTDNDGYCKLHTIVSVNELAADKHFKIYPSPVDKVLYLEFDRRGIGNAAELRIVDVLGKQVLMSKLETYIENGIDLSAFDKGVYFLQISEASKLLAVKKIVKE